MPELPEVEVVRRELEKILHRKPKISKFEFYRKDLRTLIPQKEFRKLEGQRIIKVERRAKYLIFKTSAGVDFLSHLGMTGNWRRENLKSDEILHDHIRIHLSDKSSLVYNDPRRFGFFEVLTEKMREKRFGHLGPEPLGSDWSGDSFWQSLRGKSSSIKVALMDQRIIVGVGNIYASEVLFRAGVRPSRKASLVSKREAHDMVKHTQEILARAIENGGSSISDFHNPLEEAGRFQNEHQVYGRKDQACLICDTVLRGSVLGGRSAFWCPTCQK